MFIEVEVVAVCEGVGVEGACETKDVSRDTVLLLDELFETVSAALLTGRFGIET